MDTIILMTIGLENSSKQTIKNRIFLKKTNLFGSTNEKLWILIA